MRRLPTPRAGQLFPCRKTGAEMEPGRGFEAVRLGQICRAAIRRKSKTHSAGSRGVVAKRFDWDKYAVSLFVANRKRIRRKPERGLEAIRLGQICRAAIRRKSKTHSAKAGAWSRSDSVGTNMPCRYSSQIENAFGESLSVVSKRFGWDKYAVSLFVANRKRIRRKPERGREAIRLGQICRVTIRRKSKTHSAGSRGAVSKRFD